MPTRQFSWYDTVYGGFADEANPTIRAEACDEEIASGNARAFEPETPRARVGVSGSAACAGVKRA
jgi:hypothetical protein